MWRAAKLVSRQRTQAAREMPDGDMKVAMLGFAKQSLNVPKIESLLRSARSEYGMSTTGAEWDAEPLLLGCQNGVLDLATGRLIKPQSKMRITQQANTVFDPAAKCPLWEKTLQSYWPDDDEIVGFVQRAVGYSMSGSISEQVFFCLFGEGANGKSTFLGVIQKLLGDYAYTMPFSTVEFDNRSTISNDVAALRGKRFVLSSETQEDIRLNEGRIKSLTGDSTITARFLRQEYFTFQPVGKFWLAFNHKPRIVDQSYGLWRRLRLICFNQTFDKERRVKGLEQQLLAELPGILTWAVRGCLDWQKQGLEATASILRETERYKRESNILDDYLEDRCLRQEGLSVPKADLYADYLDWCADNREKWPVGKKGFSQRILGMGIRDGHKKEGHSTVRIWLGLDIQSVNQSVNQVSDVDSVN